MKKTVRIKIKPKTEESYKMNAPVTKELKERKVERQQQEYCDEIRNLRCEMELMKAAMEEMRRHMNEMQIQMQSGYRYQNRTRIRDDMNVNGDKSAVDFGEWISGLELTMQDLETMFESNDIIDWSSKFIVADLKLRSGHPYPICAIKGSRNEMLIYDNNAWKKMTDHEFTSTIMNKMFKRLLAIFTAWKNDNYNKILTSEHFSTLYHSNYARILSFNENVSKMKTSLFHALYEI